MTTRTYKIIVAILIFIGLVLVVLNITTRTADAWKCEYHPEQPTCTTTTAPTTVPTTVPDTTTSTSTTVPDITTTTTTAPPELAPPVSIVQPPTKIELAG
jgi:hypothetical protein